MASRTSPAPRRTTVRRATSVAHEGSPPIAPRRRLKPSGSKVLSRLATPVGTVPSQSTMGDDGSVVSGMDVDVEENSQVGSSFERAMKLETIFAKSAELKASFYAHLPAEVKLVLRTTDFYREAYTGEVDTTTGFALVASSERCFVWNYSQALTGTPTCYIFACPRDIIPMPMDTPFHVLVPYGTSREPGLILMTTGGQVHFWDSLGMGLAGGEHSSQSMLGLEEEERVTTLVRADAQTYIVSTSVGRLFRLVLTSSGGKHHVSSHAFSRPQSSLSLSRLLPSFLSKPTLTPEARSISAVALGELDQSALGKDVWALVDLRVQKWNMSIEGWEELTFDEDIAELVNNVIRTQVREVREDTQLDVEMLDLKVISSNEILILVSFTGFDDDFGMDTNTQPRLIYAVVPLTHNPTGIFELTESKKVLKVPYQSTSNSGAPMHPKLQLLLNDDLIAIQFGDTVVLCAPSTEYTDRLELKSSKDRTLGIGVIPSSGENELIVMTAATIMKVVVDGEQVAQFRPETGRSNLIKSTMTQAILYGSYSENPLHFSFPPEVDEEALMTGAEQLSQAIMESDIGVVRPNHDLQAQIASRKERLSFLIKFINDNGVLTKMTQVSRQRLATDAEKLYAAQQLWQRHNVILSSGNTHSVLTEAVFTYMQKVGEGHHEDFMRAFFRLKAQDLGDLISYAMKVVRRSAYDLTQSITSNIPQANDITLTILQSALDYRNFNRRVYGMELPMIRPWTSELEIINIVSELFEMTTKLVDSLNTEEESSKARTQAKTQLPELASTLFACFHEQLQWLGSPTAAANPASERDRSELDERFRQSRPVVLETLRRTGFAEHAFKLAEDFRDFRSLASLCHKETVYPPSQNPCADRIQSYIDKYKEDFTTELYQWYIEQGELRTMFAQDNLPYLDHFFAEHRYPSVSWIHDLGRERYKQASETLLHEADHAPEIMSKHLVLSIGKLAYLAQVQESNSIAEDNILNVFHDGLDFISVHEAVTNELKIALTTVRQKLSLDMQVDTIARIRASRLSDRKASYAVFKQLVRRLLQGKALSVEDIVDVLSLKDNEEDACDYITALHLVVRSKIPDVRKKSALRSVWRRVYLHDDWNWIRQTANATDAEVTTRFLNTAFFAVLRAVLYEPGYILLPDEAFQTPTLSELSSRWSGMSSEQVTAIHKEHELERAQLEALKLDDVVDRVRELAIESYNE